MRTVALTSDQSRFLGNLAQDAQKAMRPLRVTAQEIVEPGREPSFDVEKACQSAEAYWISGYTWEEVENKLIDMGYTPETAQKAAEQTKDAVEDKLKDGPFGLPPERGEDQAAVLKTGKVVQLLAHSPKYCTVFDGEDQYRVATSELDLDKTKLLAKAAAMRREARAIVRNAQKTYAPPDLGKETKVPPPIPTPGKPNAIPQIDETYKVDFRKKTPSELMDVSPESGEVEALPAQIEKIVENLDTLKGMKDELEEKAADIRKNVLGPVQEDIKELNADQQAEAKNAFAIIDDEIEGLEGMDKVIFGDYRGEIVALRKKIVEEEKRPGVVEELDAIKNILARNHPKIFKDVQATLDTYMKANTIIERRVENLISKYPYRKKPKEGQLLEKVKQLLSQILAKVTAITDRLFNRTLPLAKQTTEALASFNKKASVAGIKVKAAAAVSRFTKRS